MNIRPSYVSGSVWEAAPRWTWSSAVCCLLLASKRAGREVYAPLLCVWACWQPPRGVRHFVSLTLFGRWEKQTQRINGCADARTEIRLISFFREPKQGSRKVSDFSAIQCWCWPASATAPKIILIIVIHLNAGRLGTAASDLAPLFVFLSQRE